MIPSDRQRALIQVIRGEKPWRSLHHHGFRISYDEGRWNFAAELEPPLRVSSSDISEGLLGLSDRPDLLREWASFVLAASTLVDLEEVEAHDALLEALWDASFGDGVKRSALDLASRLRKL